jgi:hypothetical protein
MTSILKQFTLSPPQEQAVQARERDVVVTAGAGTGKTRTLVARYLSLLADGLPLRGIVAITFTRKAAREMRNRVRADIGRYLLETELEPAELERWQNCHNGLDAARIGTIHNLCGEILRSHPAEAGLDPRFNVLDEAQSGLLLQETVEAALAWAVQVASGPTAGPTAEPDSLGTSFRHLFRLLGERPLQALIATLLRERAVMVELAANVPAETIYEHWRSHLEQQQTAALDHLLNGPEWRDSLAALRENIPLQADDKQAQHRQMVLNAAAESITESLAGKMRALSVLNDINLTGGSGKNWPGGKIRYEWSDGKGGGFYLTGEIIELEPPHRIVHIERMHLPDPTPDNHIVTTFAPDGTGTLMTMRMTLPDEATRAAMLKTGMEHGMEASYARLEALRGWVAP